MRGIYAHAVFAPTTGNVGQNLVFPFCHPFFWFEPGGGVVRGFDQMNLRCKYDSTSHAILVELIEAASYEFYCFAVCYVDVLMECFL